MMNEFKKFIARGNVVDLAVGIIMGSAFTAIVSSLVSDVLMPPIGLILGGIDFSDFFFSLDLHHYSTLAEAKNAKAVTINYGLFINAVVKFLIVSFAVFLLVKQINKLQAKLVHEDPKPTTLTADQQLLTEIRDLLKTQSQKP